MLIIICWILIIILQTINLYITAYEKEVPFSYAIGKYILIVLASLVVIVQQLQIQMLTA